MSALDELRFDPDEVTVEAGETIRFVVTNDGAGHHEFVLGSQEAQESHGEEEHGGHATEPLIVLDLPSGSTKEATITLDEPGTLLYGCHVEGHYDAGMVGTLAVEAPSD
ncbi:MAG: multicopper oxidase domain-containing protein [Actinobacteria bacterium]|nr:multicopper oxidase domain-containing protein [Actinomycetota bacterium]